MEKVPQTPAPKPILSPHQCHCTLLGSQVHAAYRASLTLLTRRTTDTVHSANSTSQRATYCYQAKKEE